jgi:type II pantothenate kinase
MSSPSLSPFCLLKDPATYVCSKLDLRAADDDRIYWVGFFKRHIHTLLKLAKEAGLARDRAIEDLDRRASASLAEFDELMDRFLAEPKAQPDKITIMTLDRWRDGILRKHGFVDCFIDLKDRENAKMLPLLPAVCAELDSLHGVEQIRAVVAGVFAGNIFDMGAEATAKRFLSHSPDFFNTRAGLPHRPWLVDDFDRLERSLLQKAYTKCVFFIDNAGSDFLLGALPMIRWLGQRGTYIVIAANERPSLNDMTIHDVRNWWPRILEAEPSLSSLPIELISTGTGEPMIDLAEVSDELNQAVQQVDLVILEGMGRGVETNLDAEFCCDALNIAMLKDARVAEALGGKVFDLVCRFR